MSPVTVKSASTLTKGSVVLLPPFNSNISKYVFEEPLYTLRLNNNLPAQPLLLYQVPAIPCVIFAYSLSRVP
jgi:hypothetical protein